MTVHYPHNSRFFLLTFLALGLTGLPVSAQISLREKHKEQNPSQEKKMMEFRVSEAGKDKAELMRVFSAVQRFENRGKLNLEDFEVMQKINLREFLVYKKTWAKGGNGGMSGNQMDGRGFYAGGGGGKGTDISTIYWLKTKEDHDVADGETLSNMVIVPTGKTREYTSVMGAKRTCRELTETGENMGFQKEEFLAALKQGKTWTLKDFSKSKCFQCGGTGKLGVMKNYAQCPDCKGKGEIPADCLVKW